MDAVKRMRFCALALAVLLISEVKGMNIRNEQLGKCVQVQGIVGQFSLALEECKAGSALQEWRWDPQTRWLRNPQTGKCLTAVRPEEHESVVLEMCRRMGEEEEGQAWSCSKKGHLTLHPKGFHLSARHDSSRIFLSTERGKSSKWRTMGKQTVCEEEEEEEEEEKKTDESQNEPEKTGPQIIAKVRLWHSIMNPAPNPTQSAQIISVSTETNSSMEFEPALVSMEYGMGWKVTMLVLTSLALVLGTVILILNIYQNRKKKTVVVLKSYSSIDEASQQGSPVPGERAPLTQNLVRPPRSPSIQRGEILVEWKDGTITPLFDTYLTS